MKRYLLLLLLLLSCNRKEIKFGDDKIEHVSPTGYWVYLAREDKIAIDRRDNAGQHKKGDIVLITKIKNCRQNTPTKTERAFFNIIRVDEINEKDIEKYTNSFDDSLAYRKYKIDDKDFTVGLDTTLLKWQNIEKLISSKTKTTLFFYDVKRVSRNWSTKVRQVFKKDKPVYRPFAEVIKKICAVGDNCTDEDYNTLTAWEDAVDGDLVTTTTKNTANCYNDDGVISENLTIDGSTTNSSYYMNITSPAGERHNGTVGSGFILTAGSGTTILVSDNYCTISYLEVRTTNAAASQVNISIGNTYTYVYNCIIYKSAGAGVSNILLSVTSSGIYEYVYNNIFCAGVTVLAGINDNTASGVYFYIYNNTIYGVTNGIRLVGTAGRGIAKNNLIYNCTTDFPADLHADSDYNFSKDDTAPGAHSIHGTTDGKTPDFVNTTTDFHLQSTSDAIGVGVDNPGSGLYSDDIDGVARTSTWDMGADEYIAPASPSGNKFGQFIMIMRGRK